MYYSGDKCPGCGLMQMPRIDPDSMATARACQSCGFIEELNTEQKRRDKQIREWLRRK